VLVACGGGQGKPEAREKEEEGEEGERGALLEQRERQ